MAGLDAGRGVVARIAAGHARGAVAAEQAPLDVALEAAAAGLAEQVGIAAHPAGIGGPGRLSIMRAVAQAVDAAVRTRLAEGDAHQAAIAEVTVAADHPAVQRE